PLYRSKLRRLSVRILRGRRRTASCVRGRAGSGTQWARHSCLHHTIFRPRMPAAGVEFLVLSIRRLVDRFRVVSGVDASEEGNDLGLFVTDAANFEIVLVDIDDVEFVLPDADFPQHAQLGTSPLDEGECGLESSGRPVVYGQWLGHGNKKSPRAGARGL